MTVFRSGSVGVSCGVLGRCRGRWSICGRGRGAGTPSPLSRARQEPEDEGCVSSIYMPFSALNARGSIWFSRLTKLERVNCLAHCPSSTHQLFSPSVQCCSVRRARIVPVFLLSQPPERPRKQPKAGAVMSSSHLRFGTNPLCISMLNYTFELQGSIRYQICTQPETQHRLNPTTYGLLIARLGELQSFG